MNKRSNWALPYFIFLVLFVVIPLLLILVYALQDASGHFTLANIGKFFSDGDSLSTFALSMEVAIENTAICILIGYPAALFIANLPERRQTLMILLLTLPMWINMLLKTYAWRGILMNFELESEIKVFIGMVYDFLPYMIIQIHTAIAKLDRNLLVAAYDLGANRWKTFLKVTLPLSVPGIISGITLVFLPAVSSFVIPKLLGGGNYVLIGNLIETYFLVAGDWNFGSAISLIMALIIIGSMYLTKKLDREAQEA